MHIFSHTVCVIRRFVISALKDITNTGSAENEDYDNHEETLRVLRPEPKKIVGENSPDSMQSNSRIYEESESKDYSAFQQYLDIGRRSTTTSGPTGEDGLFMFEGQSCYEEVVESGEIINAVWENMYMFTSEKIYRNFYCFICTFGRALSISNKTRALRWWRKRTFINTA